MRSDMNRVLIERPRYNPVPSLKNPKGYYRRLRKLDQLELLPKKEFLRKRWNGNQEEKSFNDLLGPIYRFLRSKVGQKWNDVYKEINEQNVDSHFLRHINDYVEKHVQIIGGKIFSKIRRRNYLYQPSFFYVDPEGFLREVEKESTKKRTKPSTPWINEKELRLLYKVDHVWYEIQLAVVPIPLYYMEHYDVFLKRSIRSYGQVKKYNLHFSNPLLYKHRDFYCKHKRQLSSKELKKYRKEGLIK